MEILVTNAIADGENMGGDNFNKSGISFESEPLNEYYNLVGGDFDPEKWQELVSKQQILGIEKWWGNVEQHVHLKVLSKRPSVESTTFINPIKIIQFIPSYPRGFDEKVNRFLKTKIPGLAISEDLEKFYFCNYYFINQTPKISVSSQTIEGIIELIELYEYRNEENTIFDILRMVPDEHSEIIIQALEKLVRLFDSFFDDFLQRLEKEVNKDIECPRFGMNEIDIRISDHVISRERIISQLLSFNNNARTEIQNFLDSEFTDACEKFTDSVAKSGINFSRWTHSPRLPWGHAPRCPDLELIPVFLRYIRARLPEYKVSLVCTNGDITRYWMNKGEISRMGPRGLRIRVELQTR